MPRMLIDVPDPGDLIVAADELEARAATLGRAVDQASAALVRSGASVREQGAEILRVAARKQRIVDVASALRTAAVFTPPPPAPASHVVLPGDVDFAAAADALASAKDAGAGTALPAGHEVRMTAPPSIDLSQAAIAFGAMGRDDLRAICRDSGLSSSGKKADLVGRLVDALRAKYSTTPTAAPATDPHAPDVRPIPAADDLGVPVSPGMAEMLANLRAHPDAVVPTGGTNGADPDDDGIADDPFDGGE